jgi:serine/threonine protein kinase
MEYLDSCLTDIVAIEDSDMAMPPLNEHQIAYILRSVLLALKHLHSLGRIHRDVRADNVLLSSEGLVKLGQYLSFLVRFP